MRRRGVAVAAGVAAALVFANAIPLGFALDDDPVLRLNPVVTEGRLGDAVSGPYWRLQPDRGLLYRPLTMATFVLEWELWDGAPAGFHAVNVGLHAAVTALVAALLLLVLAPPPALAGALLFAVHPVHVEAVANVVGRSELLAAGAFLIGALAFLWRPDSGGRRSARLLAVLLAYAVGLGSKEMAVTLPALLGLLAVHPATGSGGGGARASLRSDLPLFAGLGAVLGFYLVLRLDVLGSVVGELLPAELAGLTPVERLWTALTLWPQYLRLAVFPLDLVADYGPGVLDVARSPGPEVVAGAAVLGSLLVLAWTLRRRAAAVSLGIAWFVLTVLPVAHLGVHAGVLLAERTLYIPSVGVALVAGGLVEAALERGVPGRRLAAACAVVIVLLSVRTTTRTPVWDSTFGLFRDLAETHPESHRALRLYGDLLLSSGDVEGAARAFREAARVHPRRYPVLLEAGAALARAGDADRAVELLRRAVEVDPGRPDAYRLLARAHLTAGRGREAHRAAVTGLGRAGADPELYGFLSESYVLRGDLDAAARARRASLGLRPSSSAEWDRLAELLRAAGDTAAASAARARAREVARGVPATGGEDPDPDGSTGGNS